MPIKYWQIKHYQKIDSLWWFLTLTLLDENKRFQTPTYLLCIFHVRARIDKNNNLTYFKVLSIIFSCVISLIICWRRSPKEFQQYLEIDKSLIKSLPHLDLNFRSAVVYFCVAPSRKKRHYRGINMRTRKH